MGKGFPTDLVVLDGLMLRSRHGYEILRFFGSTFEGTLKVSTSQLYVLLKKLEKQGLVESSL